MISPLLAFALLLSTALSPAHAASHELSLELGSFGTRDDRFDLFHERSLLGTYGLRGGIALHDRVSLLVGAHYASTGNEVWVEGGSNYEDDYEEEGASFRAAYRGAHLLVGPKLDIPVADWGFPYLTVQGALFVGRVYLDEGPDDTENAGQLAATGLNPGGVAAVGLDIVPVHLRGGRTGFGSHIEMGYGLVAATGFDQKPEVGEAAEIARFGMGGFYLRAGVGVYF